GADVGGTFGHWPLLQYQYGGDQKGGKKYGDHPGEGLFQKAVFAQDKDRGDQQEQQQGHGPRIHGFNLEQVEAEPGRDHIKGGQYGEGGYQGDQGIDPEVTLSQVQISLHQTFFGHRGIAYPKLKKGVFEQVCQQYGDDHDPSVLCPALGG